LTLSNARSVAAARRSVLGLIVIALAGMATPRAQTSSDIVMHAADAVEILGTWQTVADTAAAGGSRLWQPNANAPKVAQASASPQNYFDLQFQAESGRAYRLWVRSKADANHWANDSFYLQFSGSIDASGAPVYRIGTTSATTVIREECSGCAFSGWGWQDNEYGNLAPGPEIRFAQSGLQRLRVQAREDGISIDQIVLSPATWFTTAPGAKNNDTTRHPSTVAEGTRPPVASIRVSLDGVWPYDLQFQDMPDPLTSMVSTSTDPDGDPLTCEWRTATNQLVTTACGWDTATAPPLRPGTHTFTLTVRDGRGGMSSASTKVTVTSVEEIVIAGAGYKELVHGLEWAEAEDIQGGTVSAIVRDLDAGGAKLNAPLASPGSYVEYGFVADPTLEYKLWVRLEAQNDHWANDSVWVQFSGATDPTGKPVFRSGTTAGLWINLEECSGCGVSGWGWRDEAWGTPGAIGSTYVRFPAGGVQGLRIQTREDGASIDTIVLSARKYKTTRPGSVKNDTTKLPMTAFWGS
jgi:hypothetical protein